MHVHVHCTQLFKKKANFIFFNDFKQAKFSKFLNIIHVTKFM